LIGDDDLLQTPVFFTGGSEFLVVANDLGVRKGNSQLIESGLYGF
jgi:hypothetical protein